jgi:hypothetical protein
MSKYLLYRSELKVIANALREYRERHCGKDCMESQNCSLYRSCEVVESDFDTFGNLIKSICFYDDEPAIMEMMKAVGKEKCEPRWQPSFSQYDD